MTTHTKEQIDAHIRLTLAMIDNARANETVSNETVELELVEAERRFRELWQEPESVVPSDPMAYMREKMSSAVPQDVVKPAERSTAQFAPRYNDDFKFMKPVQSPQPLTKELAQAWINSSLPIDLNFCEAVRAHASGQLVSRPAWCECKRDCQVPSLNTMWAAGWHNSGQKFCGDCAGEIRR